MSVPIEKLTENDRTCKKSEESCCQTTHTSGGRAATPRSGFISFHGDKLTRHDSHLGAVEADNWYDSNGLDYYGFPIAGSTLPGTRWKQDI